MFIDEYLDSPPVLTILIVDGQGEVLLGTAGSLPLYPRRPSIWFETPHNQTLVMLQHSGTAVVDLNVRTRDVKVGEDFCHLEIVQGQRLLGRFYEPKIQLAVTVEEAGTLTFYARLVDASHHVISHDSTKVEVSAKRVTQTHAAALRNHQNSDREHLSHRSELFNLIGRGVSTVCEVGFGGQGSSTMLWLHQSNVDQVVCFDSAAPAPQWRCSLLNFLHSFRLQSKAEGVSGRHQGERGGAFRLSHWRFNGDRSGIRRRQPQLCLRRCLR